MEGNQTFQVEYIGLKPREVDHLYGTGIVWTGLGDVQTVPDAAWQRMKKHNDVWREAVSPTAQAPRGADAKPKAGDTEQTYESRGRAELIDLARERGLQFDGRSSKAQVIELLQAADKAST